MRSLVLFTFLSACTPEEPEPVGPLSAPLADPTGGSCPAIDEGIVDIVSNGQDRHATIVVPEGGVNEESGILFDYYGTGGTMAYTISAMGLQSIADETGHIIVVPDAMPNNLLEWEFRTDGANDLALYDDLRTCITEAYGTDPDRVFVTGFSAGALWASFLVVHRGDTLAGAIIYSGGTDPIFEYARPDAKVPVALTWGGENDTWGIEGFFVVQFELTSANMRDELVDDGHTVIECVHQSGHGCGSHIEQVA